MSLREDVNKTLKDYGYKIERGIIVSPGKFEGEPYYAPYYYDIAMDGFADEDDGETWIFYLSDEDKRAISEFKKYYSLEIYVDDNGFVHSELIQ
jgi:hypothetical protein